MRLHNASCSSDSVSQQSRARQTDRQTDRPVELQHSCRDDHATRHLERHATKHVLQFTGVRMKCRLIEFLSTPDIGVCCPPWLFVGSTTQQ